MKTLVIGVFVCALVGYSCQADPKEFAQHMKEHKDACIKETNVKVDVAEKTVTGEFPDNKELKCYVKCMFVKFGYMSDAGEINVEFMKKHPRPDLDETKAAAAVEKCKNPAGADACEKAFNMAKCLHGELKP